jgi:hypothetical protein
MGQCNNSCINIMRKKKEFNLDELDDNNNKSTKVELNDPEILSK